MIKEHAIVYKDKLTIKELEYLVKKANRLGRSNRDIVKIYEEEHEDGIHVYFEVTELSRNYLNGRVREKKASG